MMSLRMVMRKGRARSNSRVRQTIVAAMRHTLPEMISNFASTPASQMGAVLTGRTSHCSPKEAYRRGAKASCMGEPRQRDACHFTQHSESYEPHSTVLSTKFAPHAKAPMNQRPLRQSESLQSINESDALCQSLSSNFKTVFIERQVAQDGPVYATNRLRTKTAGSPHEAIRSIF
jgi:hypothetical protein